MRIGDNLNLVPGATTIQPTSAESTAGVTVMGVASYALPVLPEGMIVLCDLDVSRNDWRVYLQHPQCDHVADATAGDATEINAIRDALVAAGLMAAS